MKRNPKGRKSNRQTAELGLPDLALMLTDVLVAFDHLKHTITILANADLEAEPDVERARARASAVVDEIRCALAGPVPLGVEHPPAVAPARAMPEFQSNMSGERFEAMVGRIIEYIYAGDAFQVVPSQRWSAPSPVQAFSIYRGLRAVNPSPYMYFLDFGDFQVAGASPEPLLTVSGRHVSTRPIAGTRPRGGSPDEDRRIAALYMHPSFAEQRQDAQNTGYLQTGEDQDEPGHALLRVQ